MLGEDGENSLGKSNHTYPHYLNTNRARSTQPSHADMLRRAQPNAAFIGYSVEVELRLVPKSVENRQTELDAVREGKLPGAFRKEKLTSNGAFSVGRILSKV